MKIELKSLKVFEEMSEETTAFVADLFINGKKVAYCKNDGRGGCTYYSPYTKELRGLLNEAEAYCKTLPPLQFEVGSGSMMDLPQDLELVIDGLVEEKEQEKFEKKRDKVCVKAFVFGTKNSYSSRGWKKIKNLNEIPRVHLQMAYDKLKADIKGTNKQIFNSKEQLESLGIKL